MAEVVPEILEWAEGPLHLTGDTLKDPRGEVVICDVAALIDDANDGTCAKWDAILLDVDNGPDGIVRDGNERLYSRTGLGKARDALKPGGVLAVWSTSARPSVPYAPERGRLRCRGALSARVPTTRGRGTPSGLRAKVEGQLLATSLSDAEGRNSLNVRLRLRPLSLAA